MAEGLVTDLINQLGSVVVREAEQEIRLVVGVEKEIEKLKGNLRTVQAVLNDAEKKQVTDETVKAWLEKLNNVCYEIEDVVDEWNTELIKSEIQKGLEENADNASVLKKQVRSFIPSPSCCFGQVDKLTRRHDIAHKIKELNRILDDITKERVSYGFEFTNYPAFKIVDNSKQTTSHVDVSDILGRDKVKNDLVSILLGEGTEKEKHPHVISLVGMGGIGKTTLAQLAYNDHKVQAHFEKRVWVCVSEPFDPCRVAKAIVEALGGDGSRITELPSLMEEICRLIVGKKLLLVFDDVWTEDGAMWKPFRDSLKNCASPSSRTLVTTRNDKVAKTMESANTIKLEELSDENCWLLFSKIAFLDKGHKQREQLEDLGRQISKKCKGLPLAAKTLGSLMRFKESREEWRSVLNNNLWELEDVERGLFAPLLLSYYDLSLPLKRCFSYCAVLPKDHVFNVEDLVYMWIAHGFVESKGNKEVEIMAREYFENLTIRSLFLKEYCRFTRIISYKMHDIVHDFAQSITKSRHLGYSTGSQFPPSTDRSKNLRTVIFSSHSDYNMSNLVQNFNCLRVLTLNSTMKLPDTIGSLIHLRYLDVHFCKEAFSFGKCVLPETIGNLCNLQFLRLGQVRPYQPIILPQGIGKLINLRLLTGNYLVIPREIGRLTSLRTLISLINDEDCKGCKFEELKNLIHLRDLTLYFNEGHRQMFFSASNDRRIESNVLILNALELPQDLEKLFIGNYLGTTMSPRLLASLTNLKELYLQSAIKLMSLPPLGTIPRLESLVISSARSLKKVGVEFLGIESKNKKEDIKIFPNLKYLHFFDLGQWEEWIGGTRGGGKEDEDCITIMPRLQKLTIECCGKLKSLPDFLRTIPLKELEINYCPIIKRRCRRGTGEDWRNISHIPIIKFRDTYSDCSTSSAI